MDYTLVTLITFTYPHEAHMVKSYLEAHGMESELKDEMTVSAHPFASNAIGGIKLLVNQSDYDNGLSLLKEGGYIKEKDQ